VATTILLTGFNRFGNLEVNPSQLVVERIARRMRSRGRADVVTVVLPTEFAASGVRIQELIRDLRPQAVVSLGVAERLSSIALEWVARNLDDAEIADNTGDLRQRRPIIPDGPTEYQSTLPLERLCNALRARDIPFCTSRDAGNYVCNHVFYVACHTIAEEHLAARCGFIHLPLLSENTDNVRVPASELSLSTLVDAVERILETLRQIIDEESGIR